jgi:Glycosyltransferase family 87
MPARMRLWWFAAVAFVAIFGIGDLAIWIGESIRGPNWWAIDFTTYDAAKRVVHGQPLYVDPKYLYPPFGALLGFPFLVIDRFPASLVLAGGKLLIAGAGVLWLTSTWKMSNRVLAVVGLITSLPFLHDLMLGNTNVLVVAAIAPSVFGRSHPRNGILLGLAAAAFAKPLLIPVLLWLVIWRRGTFVGAAVAGAIATMVGVVIFGPKAYLDWVAADGARPDLSTPFAGNHGITAVDPALWAPVAAVVTMLLILVLLRGGMRTGLVWAVASGVLLAPYAGTYAALPIALALPAIATFSPVLALVIVALSPVATTIPLPLYVAAILVASLAFREPREAATENRVPGEGALAPPPAPA